MKEGRGEEPQSYRVLLNGKWGLNDLSRFPHALWQCYAFVYCLDGSPEATGSKRLNTALRNYPWRGGYSYLNIYTVFEGQIPLSDRPQIRSISYASPGWLDIFLNVDVAIQVAKSVGILLGTAVTAAQVYAKIIKTLSGTKTEKQKAELAEMRHNQAQLKLLMSMCDDLAKFLGFKNVKALHERTGDPEISLKLLLAHYRRMSVLVEFMQKQQAVMPEALVTDSPSDLTE